MTAPLGSRGSQARALWPPAGVQLPTTRGDSRRESRNRVIWPLRRVSPPINPRLVSLARCSWRGFAAVARRGSAGLLGSRARSVLLTTALRSRRRQGPQPALGHSRRRQTCATPGSERAPNALSSVPAKLCWPRSRPGLCVQGASSVSSREQAPARGPARPAERSPKISFRKTNPQRESQTPRSPPLRRPSSSPEHAA